MTAIEAKLDAWEQADVLRRRFTKEWLVRADLRVRALGTERCVEFGLGDTHDGLNRFRMRFETTRRNVGTMREVAAALIAACDFVDEANPQWASRRDVAS